MVDCSKADVKGLEIAHRKVPKMATLSSFCDTTFTLTLLDMESAEELMDFYKLQFLGKLCRPNLPNCLAKHVFVQRLTRHIGYCDVMFGFLPDISRLVEKYELGHFIDTLISTGRFPGKSAWGRILNTSVKRPHKRQREIILNNEQWDTDISSGFKLSNSDNIWTASKKTPKYSKYCYNAVRILGFLVSRQFVSACKRCGKLSNSHVTHAFWLCEKSSLTRRKN